MTVDHPVRQVGDYDVVASIEADDEALARAVAQAELPPLMAALALATGDTDALTDDIRPPLPPMDSTIAPQGGMSVEAQVRARAVAVDLLRKLRDSGARAEEPTSFELRTIMSFLTRDAGEEYVPLLEHELALPKDTGAPAWHMDEVKDVSFKVAIIGSGFAGMAAAHRLKQAGVDFQVFEKNADVGGTWHENVYPGCRLDTPNFAYSFSFAQKPDWRDLFTTQPELEQYLQEVSDASGIRPHIRFSTTVTALEYDEAACEWSVTSVSDGRETVDRFNAVITAVGQLNRPAYPDIPGREDFTGVAFHSAEWDRDVDPSGLRVAVVGTGASAFQIVPSIVGSVKSLAVFQRHAPWMLPTPAYHQAIPEGMHWLLTHVPNYGRFVRFWQFWLASEGRMPFVTVDPDWDDPLTLSAANAELRRQLVDSISRQLADRPDLLQSMIPDYPPGAKRMTRDNGVWAKALMQPHVELVTDPIAAVTSQGITTEDGTERPFDLIVYATGFQASNYLEPMTVRGVGGVDIHERWAGDARAYMGVGVPDFPNLFMLMGPNTGVVVNGSSVFMGECTAEYAITCIGELITSGAQAMEFTQTATDEFVEWVDEGNRLRAWGAASVETWYRNSHGRASQVWPYPLQVFFGLTRALDPNAVRFHHENRAGS